MNTIPPQHQVILDGISRAQQVGGRLAIMRIYKICADILEGDATPITDISVWNHRDDKIDIVAVTDLKSGVYVQLSRVKDPPTSPTLMTVGRKFSVEISDPVTSSVVSRMFL